MTSRTLRRRNRSKNRARGKPRSTSTSVLLFTLVRVNEPFRGPKETKRVTLLLLSSPRLLGKVLSYARVQCVIHICISYVKQPIVSRTLYPSFQRVFPEVSARFPRGFREFPAVLAQWKSPIGRSSEESAGI